MKKNTSHKQLITYFQPTSLTTALLGLLTDSVTNFDRFIISFLGVLDQGRRIRAPYNWMRSDQQTQKAFIA